MQHSIDLHPKVDVYFNLHRRLWSLRSRETGRVVGHARAVIAAAPVSFVVQPAGRARAIREGQKNVHAFVRMDTAETFADPSKEFESFFADEHEPFRVSYVPSFAPHFYKCSDKSPIFRAARAVLLAPIQGPPRCLAYPE